MIFFKGKRKIEIVWKWFGRIRNYEYECPIRPHFIWENCDVLQTIEMSTILSQTTIVIDQVKIWSLTHLLKTYFKKNVGHHIFHEWDCGLLIWNNWIPYRWKEMSYTNCIELLLLFCATLCWYPIKNPKVVFRSDGRLSMPRNLLVTMMKVILKGK